MKVKHQSGRDSGNCLEWWSELGGETWEKKKRLMPSKKREYDLD